MSRIFKDIMNAEIDIQQAKIIKKLRNSQDQIETLISDSFYTRKECEKFWEAIVEARKDGKKINFIDELLPIILSEATRKAVDSLKDNICSNNNKQKIHDLEERLKAKQEELNTANSRKSVIVQELNAFKMKEARKKRGLFVRIYCRIRHFLNSI